MLVLGAGASIGGARYPIHTRLQHSLWMPSAQSFFYDLFSQEDLFSREPMGRFRFLNMLGMTHESLERMIRQAWGFKGSGPRVWKRINVEEVFTFFDIGEHMWDRRTRVHRAFAQSKEALIGLIWHLLGMRCEGQHCEHLLSLFAGLKPQDSIISFNWDTIADMTLQLINGAHFKNYVQLMTDADYRESRYWHRGLLLKLHGSLNWLVCADSACPSKQKPVLARTSDGKLMDYTAGLFKCPACGGGRTRPFIVPPTSNKVIYQDGLLRRLWMLALNQLYDVGHLVFIGYSLPAADCYSEWLFRHVQLNTARRPSITVVDPAIMHEDSVVYKRYTTIFRGFRLRRYATLAEFAADWRALSPKRCGRRRPMAEERQGTGELKGHGVEGT